MEVREVRILVKTCVMRLMSSARVLVLLCCAAVLCGGQAEPTTARPSAIVEGFQLRAGPEHLAGAPAVPAAVRCILRNVSGQVLRIVQSYAEHDYTLAVKSADGKVVVPTGDASDVWGRVVRDVEPREVVVEEYSLNRMYLLAEPGEYTITASRLVFRSAGEGFAVVESGPVALVVSADPAAQNAFASGEWGPVSEGFQLRIEVTPAVIPPRPPLLLRLTMHNVTKQALYLRPTSLLHEYRLGIADQEGREVPVTRDCIRLEQGPPTLGEVAPGSALSYEYDLNKKYDFLEPGEYTIVAKRRVPTRDGEGVAWVESNPVVLTVSEEISPM
jgi:hypothetical protein